MLARQQGCGNNHCHLPAGHRSNKCGTQRHLGLAKTDIAANQPVHRRPRGQITQHRINGAHLVFGLVIGKARLELAVNAFRRGHWRRGPQCPFGSNADQLSGNFQQLFLELGLA